MKNKMLDQTFRPYPSFWKELQTLITKVNKPKPKTPKKKESKSKLVPKELS